MTIKLHSYRSRLMEKLVIPSEAKHYINAALEDSNEMFFEAIKDVAQAHQMAAVAKKSGVARESLYRSLSKRGNPSWKTVLAVLKVVGLKIPGVEETRQSSIKMVPPNPLSFNAGQTRSFTGRRSLNKKRLTHSVAQLSFDFNAAASSPMPAIQQTTRTIYVLTVAGNPAITETLPPPYMCSLLSERNYGYARAFNAFNDKP